MTAVRNRAVCQAVLLALVIATIFGAIAGLYWRGVDKARDARITWGGTADIIALSIAISHDYYGLDGHLGYRSVADALASAIAPGGLMDMSDQSKALLSDRSAIAEALRRAASIPVAELPQYHGLNPDFLTTWAEDS
jgi:hypothetical protein